MDEEQSAEVIQPKQLLVVEDDPFLSSLLKTRLEREGGFAVYAARNGDEALQALSGGWRPDLMLLDIILPEKSGFEVLEEIRQNPEMTMPVIIISNLGQDVDVERGRELGAVDYFIKAKT